MKLRLFLVVLIFIPFLFIGQAVSQTDGVVFYSKGKMYVQYKTSGTPAPVVGESSSTTLYIDGSAKFVNDASIEQKGRTEITKDFINGKNPKLPDATPQLFVNKNSSLGENDGVIAFIGKPVFDATLNRNVATLQRIYALNYNSNMTNSSDPNQWWYTHVQKQTSWIDFPTISIEKGEPVAATNANGKLSYLDDWRKLGYLEVDTTVAMSVDYIRADKNNRFAVAASYTNANDGRFSGTAPQRIESAHVRIKGVHSATSSDPLALARYSQVNLKLYNYEKGVVDDGLFAADHTADPSTNGRTLRTASSHSQGPGWNYLTGFTPPFQQLGADYMFFHTLTKPNGGSITSYEGPIVDPFHRLKAGKGYFMSMEVSNYDHKDTPDNINSRWDFFGNNRGIYNERRARGGYVFNRSVFHDYLAVPESQLSDAEIAAGNERMDNFSRFYYNSADATGNIYGEADRPAAGRNAVLSDSRWMEKGKDRSRYELMTQEVFNTKAVVVELEKGLNFLGNPFMAPISLNPLLGYEVNPDPNGDYLATTEAQNAIGGDVATGFESDIFTPEGAADKVIISTESTTAALRAKYWLINQALVKFYAGENIFRYRTTYDFVTREGASAVTSGMQSDRIDAGAGIGNVSNFNPLAHVIAPMQMFCLQASRPVTIKLDPSLQVFREPAFFKSASTKSASSSNNVMKNWFIVEAAAVDGEADRTTIIFNDKTTSMKYDGGTYDTRKGLSQEFEEYESELDGNLTKTAYEKSKSLVYTKSSDGESLLGNSVPTRTKELALYFVPPAATQEMTLKFYGIENLVDVPGVWLVDRYMDNKSIQVTDDTEYTFVANPESDTDVTDNRFILRFYDADQGIVNKDESSQISCYYNTSTLRIFGLNDADMGSDVVIYDLQGRLMGRTKVTSTPEMSYSKPLNAGTYIVKITGKRNYTTKFVNLQN